VGPTLRTRWASASFHILRTVANGAFIGPAPSMMPGLVGVFREKLESMPLRLGRPRQNRRRPKSP